MDIRRIALTRFTCHAARTITLPPRGLVLVTGANGAGKTSIVEAVAVGLFGESVRGADHWPEYPAPPDGAIRTGKAPPVPTVVTVEARLSEAPPRTLSCTRTTNVYPRGPEGASTVRHSLAWHESSDGAPPTQPPVWENATKAAEALRERTGPFDRWARTHVFLARDGARFAGATDAERKRILETVLGLGVFDAALKACRTESRDVALRLSALDGRLATLRATLERAHAAHAAALAAVPAPVPPEALDAARAEVERARAALAAAESAQGAAWEAVGAARATSRAAADRVTDLRAALAALWAPTPAPVLPAPTRPAGVPLPALPHAAAPATTPAACPTCKRPWGATGGAHASAPHGHPPHTAPPPDGPPAARADAVPGLSTAPAPPPHASTGPDPEAIAALEGAIVEARRAEAVAHAAETEAIAALDAVRARVRDAVVAGRAADDALRALGAREADRARALATVAAFAAECDHLRDAIAEAEALGADDRETAACLAAADTALGFGGVRTRILAHALPFLGRRASVWLARLGRSGWSVRFAATRKGGVRGAAGEEAITMSLAGPPKPDYAALSGGEAKRVDLALLLALGELARAVHGGAGGTLWFDEVLDAPLDAEGAEAAADALAALARDRAVVVVAHSPDVLRALRPVLHIDLGGGAAGATAGP